MRSDLVLQAQRPYPQLHKLPQHSRSALEQVFGAAQLANPCPEPAQPAQAPAQAPAAAMLGNVNGTGYTVSLPVSNGAPAGLPQVTSLTAGLVLFTAFGADEMSPAGLSVHECMMLACPAMHACIQHPS